MQLASLLVWYCDDGSQFSGCCLSPVVMQVRLWFTVQPTGQSAAPMVWYCDDGSHLSGWCLGWSRSDYGTLRRRATHRSTCGAITPNSLLVWTLARCRKGCWPVQGGTSQSLYGTRMNDIDAAEVGTNQPLCGTRMSDIDAVEAGRICLPRMDQVVLVAGSAISAVLSAISAVLVISRPFPHVGTTAEGTLLVREGLARLAGFFAFACTHVRFRGRVTLYV